MTSRSEHRGLSRSPFRVLLLILTLVFAVEFGIMMTLPRITSRNIDGFATASIDAVLLTAVLTPVLWLVVVKPLQALSSQRALLLARLTTAQETERAILSRDLHDDLGQRLTALTIGARTIAQSADLAEARARASQLSAAAAESLDVARRLASGLRVGVLHDLGLGPALERLAEDVRDEAGLRVEVAVAIAPDRRYASEVEIGVYRIVQEALTNVVKHARASGVSIRLDERRGTLELAVRDDGAGFEERGAVAAPDTLGIQNMRERARMLGGSLRIRSAPGRGASVQVRIPVAEADHGPDHGADR